MAKYSSGKNAYIIDDRTGRKIPYRDVRTEWTGARVHKSEWEEEHPQLTPPRVHPEAQALYDPRPDNDGDGYATVDFNQVGREGLIARMFVGEVLRGHPSNGSNILTDPNPDGFGMTATLGTAVMTVPLNKPSPTGLAATGALGNEATTIEVTDNVPSFGMTASLGTPNPDVLGWGNGSWGQSTWGDS